MNTREISTLRRRLDAARALDPQDPMNNVAPHADAAIREIGQAQFYILLSCEDAIKEAAESVAPRTLADLRTDPLALRSLICSICSGHKFWLIHHMAEAIYSAAGFSDAQAWDAAHLGIHIDLKRYAAGQYGEQIVAVAV